MFEFIKKVFKRKKSERIPGVNYVEVDRVPINRVEVEKFEPKKFEPKKFEFEKFEPRHADLIWRYQYTDTGEIFEKPSREACDEIFSSGRPVHILGRVVEELD